VQYWFIDGFDLALILHRLARAAVFTRPRPDPYDQTQFSVVANIRCGTSQNYNIRTNDQGVEYEGRHPAIEGPAGRIAPHANYAVCLPAMIKHDHNYQPLDDVRRLNLTGVLAWAHICAALVNDEHLMQPIVPIAIGAQHDPLSRIMQPILVSNAVLTSGRFKCFFMQRNALHVFARLAEPVPGLRSRCG
jgi:hypothetical protein